MKFLTLMMTLAALLAAGCSSKAVVKAEDVPTILVSPQAVMNPDAPVKVKKARVRHYKPPRHVRSRHYTVAKGDTLWSIAANPSVYGNPFLWPLLSVMNEIANADLIYPGTKLRYNKVEEYQEVTAELEAKARPPYRSRRK